MTLCTGDDAQALGLCLLGCGHDGAISFGVYGNGFLQERVNALLSCILEMYGTEYGWGGDDDHIHAGVHHLLICIKSDEACLLGHFLLSVVLQTVAQVFQSVGEDISQGCHGNTIGSI